MTTCFHVQFYLHFQKMFIHLFLLLPCFMCIDYLKDLARLEKEKNVRPSPEIDAFMKVILHAPGFLCLTYHFLIICLT